MDNVNKKVIFLEQKIKKLQAKVTLALKGKKKCETVIGQLNKKILDFERSRKLRVNSQIGSFKRIVGRYEGIIYGMVKKELILTRYKPLLSIFDKFYGTDIFALNFFYYIPGDVSSLYLEISCEGQKNKLFLYNIQLPIDLNNDSTHPLSSASKLTVSDISISNESTCYLITILFKDHVSPWIIYGNYKDNNNSEFNICLSYEIFLFHMKEQFRA